MTESNVKADDDLDGLEALESEEKEFIKVSEQLTHCSIYSRD